MTSTASSTVHRPTSVDEAAVVLRDSRGGVLFRGAGTKMSWAGRPHDPDLVLETTGLDQLLEHNPADMTASAQAGMPLRALQDRLGEAGQWLALDPATRTPPGSARRARRTATASPRTVEAGHPAAAVILRQPCPAARQQRRPDHRHHIHPAAQAEPGQQHMRTAAPARTRADPPPRPDPPHRLRDHPHKPGSRVPPRRQPPPAIRAAELDISSSRMGHGAAHTPQRVGSFTAHCVRSSEVEVEGTHHRQVVDPSVRPQGLDLDDLLGGVLTTGRLPGDPVFLRGRDIGRQAQRTDSRVVGLQVLPARTRPVRPAPAGPPGCPCVPP